MTRKLAAPRGCGNTPSGAAFTLMETVIAIGVLAVLLTGFIAVFTPAAQGIRRSISSQQADRLTTTLERELVTLRSGQKIGNLSTATTGFQKGFEWIRAAGNDPTRAIFVYQYRGDPTKMRADGTMEPLTAITGQPGKDYIVQSMARRIGEMEGGKDLFEEDLKALEGPVFFVKPTQLVFQTTAGETKMVLGTAGTIKNPVPVTPPYLADADTAANYADAVIPFSAEFHSVPSKSFTSYLNTAAFKGSPDGLFYRAKNPVFTRNLAIRR